MGGGLASWGGGGQPSAAPVNDKRGGADGSKSGEGLSPHLLKSWGAIAPLAPTLSHHCISIYSGVWGGGGCSEYTMGRRGSGHVEYSTSVGYSVHFHVHERSELTLPIQNYCS